ncbi:MAG: hypothetical protein JHC98_05995 [Thermoleophilaceae bacterium]|nr:hypothetical protein [Thermoleophilaceae bacterium]
MSTPLRRFNDAGRNAFANAVAEYRDDPARPSPAKLIHSDEHCEDVSGSTVELEKRPFVNRFEFAEYLHQALGQRWRKGLELDRGLVDWVDAFYFEALTQTDGKLKVGEDARHVASSAFNRAYRHLVAGPLWSYELHGENARALLSTRLSTGGDYFEQLASRQQLHTNPTIISTAQRLYFDGSANKLRKGALSIGRPGELRRFITLVQQLDLNFDLYDMSVERLVDLLPEEFDVWTTQDDGVPRGDERDQEANLVA